MTEVEGVQIQVDIPDEYKNKEALDGSGGRLIPSNENALGYGGGGLVFKGWDVKLSKEVAIKRFFDNSAGLDSKKRESIMAEIERAGKSEHPGSVPVYETFEDEDGNLYMEMQLLPEGSTLRERLEKDEHLPKQALEAFIHQAAEVTDYHSNPNLGNVAYYHRDYKPANFALIENNVNGRVQYDTKVMDVGIAVDVRTDDQYESGDVYGSPKYIAPEVLKREPFDVRSDIYSLGNITYELFTGEPRRQETGLLAMVKKTAEEDGLNKQEKNNLFQSALTREGIDEAAAHRIVASVDTAVRKDPEDRFDTAKEYAQSMFPREEYNISN